MKIIEVIAFNGSPKSEGNTYHALKIMQNEFEKEEIEVEILQECYPWNKSRRCFKR
ncbi:NAD(P)H-dependent oxidoreductase [Halanaerobium congolense]|uniref:NAD(P)H-dependent oxidoreductase n=1 Tax=Halanaerobium congolense TaxID=54121 RepID=UPI0031343F2E